MSNNIVLGRGEVFFSRFLSGTETAEGFRYIGNTPSFGVTPETNDLDHYNADAGIKVKDYSITLETNYASSIVCDNIDPENLGLFLFGAANTIAQASATGATWSKSVKQGLVYQIGESDTKPTGDRTLSSVAVTSASGGTTHVIDTDYTVDLERGLLTIVDGGGIADDTEVEVEYDAAAVSRSQVTSGTSPVNGAILFKSNNPVGLKRDFLMPKVTVRPNGEMQLKGDEWQQMGFNIEILTKTGQSAIYADGLPYVAS